jgi:hypothetical protein
MTTKYYESPCDISFGFCKTYPISVACHDGKPSLLAGVKTCARISAYALIQRVRLRERESERERERERGRYLGDRLLLSLSRTAIPEVCQCE